MYYLRIDGDLKIMILNACTIVGGKDTLLIQNIVYMYPTCRNVTFITVGPTIIT